MAGVRLIVQTTHESAEAAEEALKARVDRCRKTEAEEEGCIQYEVFRSAMNPNKVVLLEHWASQDALDKHLALLRSSGAGPRPGAAPANNALEVYEQKPGELPRPR
jgi:quinol monooxygenase YgiN